MRLRLEEAAKLANTLMMSSDDWGCALSVQPYGFLVEVRKEEGEKILRKIRMVSFDEVDLAKFNPLATAIDDLASELRRSTPSK